MMGGPIPLRGRVVYAVALVLFVSVSWLAWQALPPIDFEWVWLGITLALACLTLVLNGGEYVLAGRLLGHRVDLGEAIRVTVLASAANLLPVPGAVLVRSEALRRRGIALTDALRGNAAVGAVWVSTALLLAGGLQLWTNAIGLGSVMALTGLMALGGAAVMAGISPRWPRWMAWALGLEVAFVVISSLRLFFVFKALGIPCTLAQAVAIAVAGALASAFGVFPGGLGLAEALAGGLAALVRLPAAAGAAVAAVDRLVGWVPVAVTAALIGASGRASGGPDRSLADPAP